MSQPTRIRNRTPHDPLRIWRGDELLTEIPADGPAARCTEVSRSAEPITALEGDVPNVRVDFGEVSNLPNPEPDTIIVVSQLVCQTIPKRQDLYFPFDLRRDASGNVVGCAQLAQLS